MGALARHARGARGPAPAAGAGQPGSAGPGAGGGDARTPARSRHRHRASSLSPRTPARRCARAAIKALGEIEAADVPDRLRAALLDESSLVRQQAVLSLGEAPGSAGGRRPPPLLDDPDPKMRFVTLRALGQIRSRDVVPRITTFLGDARKELRFAAVEALGSIRAVEAVRPLVDVLSRLRPQPPPRGRGEPGRDRRPAGGASAPPRPRGRALVGPVRGRDRARPDPQLQGRPALLTRLDDDDATVRRAVVAALGRDRGRARAGAASTQLLSDPALQPAALEALRRMGPSALAELERAFAGAAPDARPPDRGPRGQARGPPGTAPPARRPRRRQRAGARRRRRWPSATAASSTRSVR